jgi:hypothetical protein
LTGADPSTLICAKRFRRCTTIECQAPSDIRTFKNHKYNYYLIQQIKKLIGHILMCHTYIKHNYTLEKLNNDMHFFLIYCYSYERMNTIFLNLFIKLISELIIMNMMQL